MPQEFTVRQWKAWKEDDGTPITDPHGNVKGSVVFEEHANEPVDATFKQAPNPGDKKYGVIEDYQTKSGNTRTKFSRRDRPQEGSNSRSGGKSGRDDNAIRAQWAIGQAVQIQAASKVVRDGSTLMNELEATAKSLYAMVDRVKDSNGGNTVVTGSTNPGQTQTFSNGEPLPVPDRQFEVDPNEPINLDDIPF